MYGYTQRTAEACSREASLGQLDAHGRQERQIYSLEIGCFFVHQQEQELEEIWFLNFLVASEAQR